MKKLIYILCFLPTFVVAQYDFEIGFFKMDLEALTDVPDLDMFALQLGNTTKDFQIKSFSDFNRVTETNYWEAVDMAAAIEKKERLKKAYPFDAKTLQQKFSLDGRYAPYAKDGSSKVNNPVYKEAKGLYFVDACPLRYLPAVCSLPSCAWFLVD